MPIFLYIHVLYVFSCTDVLVHKLPLYAFNGADFVHHKFEDVISLINECSDKGFWVICYYLVQICCPWCSYLNVHSNSIYLITNSAVNCTVGVVSKRIDIESYRSTVTKKNLFSCIITVQAHTPHLFFLSLGSSAAAQKLHCAKINDNANQHSQKVAKTDF